MLRIFAIVVGIIFIFMGVAGFSPSFTQQGLLFNLFEVNVSTCLIYMITGVLAIMAATSYRYTRLYFALFGFVYTIAGIMGFARSGDLIVTHTNYADNVLYIVIGVLTLYLAFSSTKKKTHY